MLFIEEARAALGSAVPARFLFAAGDCLERQGQTAEAVRLYGGFTCHHDAAIARRAAAWHERLLRKLRCDGQIPPDVAQRLDRTWPVRLPKGLRLGG